MRKFELLDAKGERLAWVSRSRADYLLGRGEVEQVGELAFRFRRARPTRLDAAATARDALRPADSVNVGPRTMRAFAEGRPGAVAIVNAHKDKLKDRRVRVFSGSDARPGLAVT